MMAEQEKQLEILTLFSFLITSAFGCVREPRGYGSLRLIGVMDKLYALLHECYGYDCPELKALIAKAQESIDLYLTDETAFTEALDRCVLAITQLLKQL